MTWCKVLLGKETEVMTDCELGGAVFWERTEQAGVLKRLYMQGDSNLVCGLLF